MSSAATLCFHCQEDLRGSTLLARVGSEARPVCCAGCRAVAEMIAESGLADFYVRRSAASPRPERARQDPWSVYAQPGVQAEFVKRGPQVDSIDLLIENLRCTACGWLIERVVSSLPGIQRVDVNAVLGRAHIEWTANESRLEAVMRAIAELGYVPHPLTSETTARVHRLERNSMLKRFVVATFGMMQVMMFAVADYSAELNGESIEAGLAHYFRLVSLLVCIPVLFYAGRPFLSNAWNSLRSRTIGMDLPVSAALLLAFIASTWNTLTHHGEVYFDSITMFVFFLTLSRCIELAVRHRTNSVTDALAQHLPASAQRIEGQRIETVAVNQLRSGDRIIVPSGATVPADGAIVDADALLDESLLTGESLPVARRCGETVASGSINAGSPLRIDVTAVGANTTLSTLVALLQRAQTQKPRQVHASARAAGIFLRVVMIASVFVCAGWLLVDADRAFSATLAVLVVACPCAFSIASPAALAASTAHLAREGVLVANPDALETLASAQHVVFDKTGTLTCGVVELEECLTSGRRSREECLAIAAALELASAHPIARAFKDVDTRGLFANELRTVPGFGIEGRIDGKLHRIGLAAFVAELRGETLARDERPADTTVVCLGDERQELASFILSDRLREDSRHAVAQLHKLAIETEILSGDSHAAVAGVARECKVPRFFARRTPAQKVARVRELQDRGEKVVMLGDGINDAPVLGAADVSIAMGRGASLAMATADLVLVSERPSALPEVIHVARRAVAIARQNLIWSATYNFCALPLAAFGLISPWVAAIGMSASSLLVLLNALRLLPCASTRTMRPTQTSTSRTSAATLAHPA